MSEAVIVATARTPIGKAYRGSFNNTSPITLAGHVIEKALDRAGVEAIAYAFLRWISGTGGI